MRTREEICDDRIPIGSLTLEVLLDLRDQNEAILKALNTKPFCAGSGVAPENLYALGPASTRGFCGACKREVAVVRSNDRANNIVLVDHQA